MGIFMVRGHAKHRICRNLRSFLATGSLVLAIGLCTAGCSGKESTAEPPPPASKVKETAPEVNQSDAGAIAYQLNICSDSLAEIRDILQQVGPEAKGDAKTVVDEAAVMAEDLGVGLEEILDDVEKVPDTDKKRWEGLFTELSDAMVDLEALGERVETLATSEGRGGVTDTFSKMTENYEASWAAMDESINLAARIAGVNREVTTP